MKTLKKFLFPLAAIFVIFGVMPITVYAQGPYSATVGTASAMQAGITATLSITDVVQKQEPNVPQADSAQVYWQIHVAGKTSEQCSFNYTITANGNTWSTGSFAGITDTEYADLEWNPLTGYGGIAENTTFSIELFAVYSNSDDSGDSPGNGDGAPSAFSVILSETGVGASGGGTYNAGDEVNISAGEMGGYGFGRWTTDDAELENPSSPNTSFVMPANDVTIIASWVALDSPPNNENINNGSGGWTATHTVAVASVAIVAVAGVTSTALIVRARRKK